ncbi:MAG: hypothetical protein ABI549_09460 [Flavobacterium sp.]|uniref:hypothetical protein n=1 Tax=Flavobacterium sp. TaxID=239 RepID=UPI003265984D
MKVILLFILFVFTIGSYSQQSFKQREIHHDRIVKEVKKYSLLELAADYLSSDFKINYNYSGFHFRLSMRNFFNIYADEPNFNFNNLSGNSVTNFNKININKEIPVYIKGKIIYKF